MNTFRSQTTIETEERTEESAFDDDEGIDELTIGEEVSDVKEVEENPFEIPSDQVS